MKQWAINFLLFVLSLTAIIFALLKVTPFEINEGTYIGTIATLIGISVSILIGYQVYNAIEMRGQLEKQKEASKKLQDMYDKAELKRIKQEAEMNEGFDILSALIEYNRGRTTVTCLEALYHMHRALIYSLETERTDYEWIFKYIRQYLTAISKSTFTSSSLVVNENKEWFITDTSKDNGMPFKEFILRSLKPIYENDKIIRSHSNFPKIKMEYNRVMEFLNKRINEIVKNPYQVLSPEEKETIINPEY